GDPPEDVPVLEVDEPPAAVRVVDERALVRAVHAAGALLQHDPVLVGPAQVGGAEDDLVAVGDSSGGGVDPVLPVLEVGLGAFEGEHVGDLGAVDDHLGGGQGGGEVRGDLQQR